MSGDRTDWLLFAMMQAQIIMLIAGLSMVRRKERRSLASALLVIGSGAIATLLVIEGVINAVAASIFTSATIVLGVSLMIRHVNRMQRDHGESAAGSA